MHTNNNNSGNSQPGQARHDRAAICNWKYISKIHRIHRTFVWHRNGSCARCGKFDRRTDERQRDMLFAYTAFASDIENMERDKKLIKLSWKYEIFNCLYQHCHQCILQSACVICLHCGPTRHRCANANANKHCKVRHIHVNNHFQRNSRRSTAEQQIDTALLGQTCVYVFMARTLSSFREIRKIRRYFANGCKIFFSVLPDHLISWEATHTIR